MSACRTSSQAETKISWPTRSRIRSRYLWGLSVEAVMSHLCRSPYVGDDVAGIRLHHGLEIISLGIEVDVGDSERGEGLQPIDALSRRADNADSIDDTV